MRPTELSRDASIQIDLDDAAGELDRLVCPDERLVAMARPVTLRRNG